MEEMRSTPDPVILALCAFSSGAFQQEMTPPPRPIAHILDTARSDMDAPNDDVPDATDWLKTPLQAFSQLETALHCQICKEFYNTPMITSCSHTFCSRCIRNALSADGTCPACRASDQAGKLRNNWAMQEVVTTFLTARPAALALARQAQEDAEQPPRSRKRRRITVPDVDEAQDIQPSARTTRSQSRKVNASQTSQPEPTEVEVEQDALSDQDSDPQPDDGLVECPLGCGKRMKIESVEPHLDRCDDEKKEAERARSRKPHNGMTTQPPFKQTARPQDRLAELNYSMVKEMAMSKKLRELGVPNWGGKTLMVNRHKEWVNIWNANCDSSQPRTKRDLLRELDAWERTQGGHARQQSHGPANGIMRKDFDGAGWASRNKDEFSRLIADAKRQKSNVPTASEPAAAEPRCSKSRPKSGDLHVAEIAKLGSSDNNSDTQTSPPTSSFHATPAGQPPPESASMTGDTTSPSPTPYADHPNMLANVRAKVDMANRGEHMEPAMNAGFAVPGVEHRSASVASVPATTVTDPADQPPSIFGRASEVKPGSSTTTTKTTTTTTTTTSGDARRSPTPAQTGLAHLAAPTGSPLRKVPMFALPQEPVTDVDRSSAG